MHKRTVAIVDDDDSMRQAISTLLRSLGHAVALFSSAEEFLGSSVRGQVGCLITDMQMPGLSGLELYQKLKTMGETIPTILITAYPDETTRKRAREAGVSCYLGKPFGDDEIVACLNKVYGAG